MAGGRPKTFNNPEQLKTLVDNYIKECNDNDKPPTIAGLAYSLGVDRKTIWNYEQRDEFFPIIKKARDFIMSELEIKLMQEGKGGQIFLAKNYGYADKVEIENTGDPNTYIFNIPRPGAKE